MLLAAEQEGDHIHCPSPTTVVAWTDALRKKAVEKGILDSDAAARLTDVEAFNLIFAPGRPKQKYPTCPGVVSAWMS